MSQVGIAWVGRADVVVAQVPGGHHPKRPDRRQRSGFGPAKRVGTFACIVDELPLAPARQIEMARKNVAGILRSGSPPNKRLQPAGHCRIMARG
jgi:hypothetical protein